MNLPQRVRSSTQSNINSSVNANFKNHEQTDHFHYTFDEVQKLISINSELIQENSNLLANCERIEREYENLMNKYEDLMNMHSGATPVFLTKDFGFPAPHYNGEVKRSEDKSDHRNSGSAMGNSHRSRDTENQNESDSEILMNRERFNETFGYETSVQEYQEECRNLQQRIEKYEIAVKEKDELIDKLHEALQNKHEQIEAFEERCGNLNEQLIKCKTKMKESEISTAIEAKEYKQQIHHEQKKIEDLFAKLSASEDWATKLTYDYELLKKELLFQKEPNDFGLFSTNSLVHKSPASKSPRTIRTAKTMIPKQKSLEEQIICLQVEFKDKKKKYRNYAAKLEKENQILNERLMDLSIFVKKQQFYIENFVYKSNSSFDGI